MVHDDCVSIHAPARGATHAAAGGHHRPQVSIHAPARGATRFLIHKHPYVVFQSTRPRGARPAGPCFGSILRCFNPRARAGRDITVLKPLEAMVQFQSTRPRGARPDDGARSLVTHEVSIHAPARGATARGVSSLRKKGVSIHAPARGAT